MLYIKHSTDKFDVPVDYCIKNIDLYRNFITVIPFINKLSPDKLTIDIFYFKFTDTYTQNTQLELYIDNIILEVELDNVNTTFSYKQIELDIDEDEHKIIEEYLSSLNKKFTHREEKNIFQASDKVSLNVSNRDDVKQLLKSNNQITKIQYATIIQILNNPDYDYYHYSNSEQEEFVKQHYKKYYTSYKTILPGAFRTDIFRLTILHKYGGIYFDNKIAPNRPLTYILPEDADMIVLDDTFKTKLILINGILKFSKQSIHLESILDLFDDYITKKRNDYMLLGPELTKQGVEKTLKMNFDVDYKTFIADNVYEDNSIFKTGKDYKSMTYWKLINDITLQHYSRAIVATIHNVSSNSHIHMNKTVVCYSTFPTYYITEVKHDRYTMMYDKNMIYKQECKTSTVKIYIINNVKNINSIIQDINTGREYYVVYTDNIGIHNLLLNNIKRRDNFFLYFIRNSSLLSDKSSILEDVKRISPYYSKGDIDNVDIEYTIEYI